MLRERRRHANFKPNRKLDRKSSRGMIYENEELRLRTININAEVERGQSDIKKLRRENDLLRKEIWTLRDEYDRLDKLLRAHKTSEANKKSRQDYDDDEDEDDDDSQSDDSGDDDDDDDEDGVTAESSENQQNARLTRTGHSHKTNNVSDQQSRERLHVNFDHLSIVSEETAISYSDEDNAMELNRGYRPKSPSSPGLSFDFQSSVPPLAHFENLCYEKIGPNLDASGHLLYADDSPGPTTASTGDTVIPAIGWDFSKIPPTDTRPHSDKPPTTRSAGPPDFVVSMEPTTSRPITPTHRSARTCSPSIFPTGGNLDDLLLDIEHLTKDLAQMQLANNRRQQPQSIDDPVNDNWLSDKKPPYRSEMNLLLSFDGENPTITNVSAEGKTAAPTPQPPAPPNTPSVRPVHQDSPPPQIPAPMSLLPVTLPYVEFHDTRQPVPDAPSALPPSGATNREGRLSNFATIRRKLFTRKPSVVVEPASKTASEVHSSSSEAVGTSNLGDREATAETSSGDHSTLKPPATSSHKRKSRRVSIDFNNGSARKSSGKDQRRGSTVSCGAADDLSTGGLANGKKTGSRKMSQSSGRQSRSKKPSSGRRHSDGGGYSGGGGATDGSERTSNSLASSRESSTSLSTRSQKSTRKISIGSHGGGTGSIPWCACWGNGCI